MVVGVCRFALILAAWTLACRTEVPEPDSVRHAFVRYMALVANGDYEGVFGLLIPEARDRIAKTHANIRRCKDLIERHYPEVLRAQALADLGPPDVRNAPTPARFFAALISTGGRPPLSIGDRLRSQIRRITRSDMGTHIVTTFAGERFEWMEGGDGRFYYVPDANASERIQNDYLASVQKLQAVQSAVKSFERAR